MGCGSNQRGEAAHGFFNTPKISRVYEAKTERQEIPGFNWLIAKNKPNFFFALTRDKQTQKTQKHKNTKTAPQKHKNTKKTPFFFALTREKKAFKKASALTREKKSCAWLIADEQNT